MAIYLTDKDGSDQHFDTYAEFEQAMVLMSRIGGNKVPQDLLDEVKSKYGYKESKTFNVEVDGTALVEKLREVQAGLEGKLDDWAEEYGRVEFISDDKLDEETYEDESESAIEVGDKVRVISADDGTSFPYHYHAVGSVGKVVSMQSFGRIEVDVGGEVQYLLPHHYEKENVEEASSPEFRTGDIVRATEDVVGFSGNYIACNAGELLEVQTGGSGAMCLVKDSWKNAYVSENLANIELVCRKEDRKDIDL